MPGRFTSSDGLVARGSFVQHWVQLVIVDNQLDHNPHNLMMFRTLFLNHHQLLGSCTLGFGLIREIDQLLVAFQQ